MSKRTRVVRCRAVVIASCCAVAFGVASAQAASFTPGNIPQQPFEENILLGGDETDQLVLHGTTNQTQAVFTLTGTEGLSEPSVGEARVVAFDGGFTTLSIASGAGPVFTDVLLNIILNGNGQVSGNVQFTTAGTDNSGSGLLPLGNGNNFFTIVADPDTFFTSVVLVENGAFDIQDVRQIRVSGVGDPFDLCISQPHLCHGDPTEPSTLALLGGSVIGFVALGARRLNRG